MDLRRSLECRFNEVRLYLLCYVVQWQTHLWGTCCVMSWNDKHICEVLLVLCHGMTYICEICAMLCHEIANTSVTYLQCYVMKWQTHVWDTCCVMSCNSKHICEVLVVLCHGMTNSSMRDTVFCHDLNANSAVNCELEAIKICIYFHSIFFVSRMLIFGV